MAVHMEYDKKNKHGYKLILNKKSYGKIPLIPALRDKNPWEVVHVDCCGPWKIRWLDEETRENTEKERQN